MARYAYQSMNAAGKMVRGTMEAANLPDLELRLKRMELDLIDCKLQGQKAFRQRRGKVSRKDLINFCFYMEQLSGAGVPMLEGLGDLRDSMDNPRFRGVVADLIENIEGGAQLSEAMGRHPHIFDKTFTSLVTAGEQSAEITEVFRNLADNLKWQDELASQTRKVLMYPTFVGTIVLGVTVFLMIFLVPQLTGFIKSMGQDLPFHTRALIFVSNVFINYWYAVLATPVMLFIGIKLLLHNSAEARYKAAGYKLRIPLIGPILYKIILARFATFFALLYASGITILDCIRLCEEIVANEVVANGLRRARQAISDGQGVTAAFQSIEIFPPLVIRMLKVGEATGSMDTALRNVSYFYNREIKEMIEKVQSLIEPVMTVILGLILGWIMLSVLGPIYDTISKVKV
ncbi:MAG TPA: type II secretion system F family protein [Noviherbaspirillum sp.]|jgi:type IV pilus assembly protein PilC|uniref:type II secretion system F family protein n=1 Tax=Noviherbaspirillum sp. TaxID=1926288 RepID=UPI002DDD50AC|nr:type II secretion system F family protein [Noviherbaspirillum sp.]HEV2611810.1 type II secretion system F family protein [Noviherbaspirillum sp.]